MRESAEQLREELERARARLGELERDRRDFVAILTHDMRGLLTGVVGAVDLLRELGATERDLTVAEFATMVERNGDELLRMIANLLDLYRIEDGWMPLERAAIDLAVVAHGAVDFARPMADANRVCLELSAAPAGLVGDPTLLGRVVANLLANAIGFSPPGAAVRVAVGPGPGDGSGRPGALLSVADAGPDVRPEEQTLLFDRFSQEADRNARRRGGSGLGLAFCRRAVELHGGRISVESAPDAGATFLVTLPPRPPEGVGRVSVPSS